MNYGKAEAIHNIDGLGLGGEDPSSVVDDLLTACAYNIHDNNMFLSSSPHIIDKFPSEEKPACSNVQNSPG